MEYDTHIQLLKELFKDIKYYVYIYLEYETIDVCYLYGQIKHSFFMYLHKLETERQLYKQRRKRH